jgi:hypothetical protein
MPGHPGDVTAEQPDVSRLLVAEPPLLVLPSLAVAVGLNEAIFLQQLHYWLRQSGKEREGRRWVYNTYEEWAEQLPFWSVRTIRRIVGELEERGLVVSTTAYNAQKIDRTKWYTIDYAAVARLTKPADHVAKMATWNGQEARMHVANLAHSVPETTQETTEQRKVEFSKARPVLTDYVTDVGREFADQAPLQASVGRALNLYQQSGLELSAFIDVLMLARARTKERSAAIKTQPTAGWGPKPRMPYFFAVLEDLLGLRAESDISPSDLEGASRR